MLSSAPFATIQFDGPTAVDSNGEFTAVADTESRRALIMNADDDLTGIVSCTTIDSPGDAITDVCVSGGLIYLSSVRFAPDSDAIELERVVAYDKGGNLQGVVYELPGSGGANATIKSLNDSPDGTAIAKETRNGLAFTYANMSGTKEGFEFNDDYPDIYDAALSNGPEPLYATLSTRGLIGDGLSDDAVRAFSGHVFTSIDISDDDGLFACDDATGALFAITPDPEGVRPLVPGNGYDCVHANGSIISLCSHAENKVVLCEANGTITREFTEVTPSIGFSARMSIVWASGLYLGILALVLAIRKIRRLAREGKMGGIGPALTAIAVTAAVVIAIGNLS